MLHCLVRYHIDVSAGTLGSTTGAADVFMGCLTLRGLDVSTWKERLEEGSPLGGISNFRWRRGTSVRWQPYVKSRCVELFQKHPEVEAFRMSERYGPFLQGDIDIGDDGCRIPVLFDGGKPGDDVCNVRHT